MKKLILLLAVTLVVFSCSKDNVNTETETTADLTQMTPAKSLDQSSEGMYYGVFGHNSIKELHGKILINAGNNGNYSALINMVNGDDIRFQGISNSRTNIHFTSDRGSFDFNAIDFKAPVASNVFIDNQSESYIVAKKSTTRGGGTILLGTYEETGNESNFFGNWDMFGDGNPGGGPFGGELLIQVAVSHKGNIGPFVDSTMEAADYCIGAATPAFTLAPGGGVIDIWTDNQTSSFTGPTTTWDMKSIVGFHGDDTMPYSPPGTCDPAAFGTWSWAGKTGTMLTVAPPAPISNDGQNRVIASPYTK